MWWLTNSWEGTDDKPLSSSSVITLWAHPRAVTGSSQTLFPTLPFPFEWVMGGVEAVISIVGVGDDGIIWIGEETVALPFSSCNFCLFGSKVSWERGSCFIPLICAYFSLLYWMAISTRNNNNNKKLKKKERWEFTRMRQLTFCFSKDLLQYVLNRLRSKTIGEQMTRVDQVVKILDLLSKGKGSLNPFVIWTFQF